MAREEAREREMRVRTTKTERKGGRKMRRHAQKQNKRDSCTCAQVQDFVVVVGTSSATTSSSTTTATTSFTTMTIFLLKLLLMYYDNKGQ